MSSKLVKKLLNQTNIQSEDNEVEYHSHNESKKRRITPRTKDTTRKITREEAIHGHIQSILRLDNLVHDHTSTVAQKSFTRRSSDLKQQSKKAARSKKSGVGISNSRTSSSSFSQRQQEPTFNKEKDKRKKEEEYYSDIARALKKAKKNSKR